MIFVVPIATEDSLATARRWVQSWYLTRLRTTWLQTLPTHLDYSDSSAVSSTSSGRRSAAGVGHLFLFPAHTRDTGYEPLVREVLAFGRVMRPALDAHSGT